MPKQADPDAQYKRFIETARELGCDEDEAAFDEKLKRIAQPRPKKPAIRNARRRPKEPG